MKARYIPRIAVAILATLTGCTTIEPRVNNQVLTRTEVKQKIARYCLNSWESEKGLYAEGRTYGMHFEEYATSTELLDGNPKDGCQRDKTAIKRKR